MSDMGIDHADRLPVRGIHSRTHEFVVDGCWGCKMTTLQFTTPFSEHTATDREFDADQQAYKRLRKDGLQPVSPQGAAEVERHQLEQVEIDMKMKLPKDVKERHKETLAEQALKEWTGAGVNG